MQLADHLSISQSCLSKWESGAYPFDADVLEQVAQLVGGELPDIEEMVAAEKARALEKHNKQLMKELIRDQAAKDLIADKMITAIQSLP